MVWNFILYLLYGLAFFTLGIAILSRDTRLSELGIARILWLLAGFGIIHGFHEWLELLEQLNPDIISPAFRRSLEELKFQQQLVGPGMDEALSCLSNQIRRRILTLLTCKGRMKFMDITRHLKISDHTKVNFHLKNLKANNLVCHDPEKYYTITAQGEKMVACLSILSKQIPQ